MMSRNENKKLRRFLIDTDTGSDDVWAIIEALRATEIVRVEAITVVCGNLPLDLCVKNAMLAVDAAGIFLRCISGSAGAVVFAAVGDGIPG